MKVFLLMAILAGCDSNLRVHIEASSLDCAVNPDAESCQPPIDDEMLIETDETVTNGVAFSASVRVKTEGTVEMYLATAPTCETAAHVREL